VRRVVFVSSFALGVAAMLACGSFGSGNDAPSATATPDAALDATGATTDAGEGDAEGDGSSGGPDAGPPDAKVAGPCTQVYASAMTALPSWMLSSSAGSDLLLDVEAGAKAPPALRAVVDGGAFPESDLYETFQLPSTLPSSVRLSFSLNIAKLVPSDDYAEIGCVLALRNASTTFAEVKLLTSSGVLRIDEKVSNAKGASFARALGVWFPVTVSFEALTATTATSVVTVAGTERFRQGVTHSLVPDNVRIECGIDYADPTASSEVLVDDVTLSFCPD
jgi:hypothetical protein